MGKKQLNWMCTIWNEEEPFELSKLPDLKNAYTQLETTGSGKLHWQTFIMLNTDRPASHIFDWCKNNNIKIHVGSKEGKEFRTKYQGINYVHGDGEIALKKLANPNERYIIKGGGGYIHCPLEGLIFEKWNNLRDAKDMEIIKGNVDNIDIALRKLVYDKYLKNGIILNW